MFGEKSDQKLLAMGVMGVCGGHGGVICPKYFYQFFRLQMPWNGEKIDKNILTHDPHMTPAMTPMTPNDLFLTFDPSVRTVLFYVSRESAQRMWLNSNSGWSLSITQFWESKRLKIGKVPFPGLGSKWVKMVKKSKFSKMSQTIPKHDWTSQEQCFAISD